jgi:hypothetical protein
MPSPTVIATVRARLAPRLPGAVALLDIADCKRRNLYLGWRRVDADIHELDALVGSTAGAAGCRVAGDQWMMAGKLTPESLAALIARFDRTDAVPVRCISRARQGGGPWKEAIHAETIPIRRTVRCLYLPSRPNIEALLAGWEALQTAVKTSPVAEVTEERSVPTPVPGLGERWRAAADPCREWKCLLCGGTEFTWTGGADDASEGVCEACGAEVDFRIGGA